jgi:hypothetical protein
MFAGHQIFYQPPYAWLMRLPIFGSVRVPARFGTLAFLTLATSGALAFNRLRLHGSVRTVVASALLGGILADVWVAALPLPTVPDFWSAARSNGFAAVMELPLGSVYGDLAATYRAIDHKRPIVNGNSGFEPPHYFTLKTAIEEHDPTAFDGLPPAGPVLIVVDDRDDPHHEWDRFLLTLPRVRRIERAERRTFYALEPAPPASPPCVGDLIPIAAVSDDRGPMDATPLIDHDPHTWWSTPHPQRVGDRLLLDLGRLEQPCAVSVSVGEFRKSYARQLVIDTSSDGAAWNEVASLRTAGLTMQAALADPRRVTMTVGLNPSRARFVRLSIGETHPTVPWTLTEVSVTTMSGRD